MEKNIAKMGILRLYIFVNITGKKLFLRYGYLNHVTDDRVASYAEWMTLYVLCKDIRGFLHKETIRAVYDGSLFHKMEKERVSR